MADDKAAKPAGKGGKAGLIVGLVLMLLCGGGGFYAVYSGLIPTGGGESADAGHAKPAASDHAAADAHAAPADSHGGAADAHAAADDGHGGAAGGGGDGPFVAMTPILVTVGGGDHPRHLQFGAQLEVAPGAGAEVAALMPRAVDVLTTYLRAVSPADVDDPAAMLRMRAQMLRRIQVVMGEGKVRDLLVSEFVMR